MRIITIALLFLVGYGMGMLFGPWALIPAAALGAFTGYITRDV